MSHDRYEAADRELTKRLMGLAKRTARDLFDCPGFEVHFFPFDPHWLIRMAVSASPKSGRFRWVEVSDNTLGMAITKADMMLGRSNL